MLVNNPGGGTSEGEGLRGGRFTWIAAGGLVLLAAALRFGPTTAQIELSWDEAFSWRLAGQGSLSTMLDMTARDVHPPLYYVLLRGWVGLWGDSEFALRSLSGLLGMLTVAATAWFTYLWMGSLGATAKGRNTVLLAALMAAVMAPLVEAACNARMYALLQFLTVLSLALLLKSAAGPQSFRWWAAYGASAAALLYTHNYAVLLLGAQAAWLCVEGLVRRGDSSSGGFLFRAAFVYTCVLALFSPWLPVLLAQVIQTHGGGPIDPPGDPVGLYYMYAIFGTWCPPWVPPAFMGPAFGMIAVMHIWPWRWAPETRLVAVVVLTHLLAAAVVAGMIAPYAVGARYLLHLLPMLIPPLAAGLLAIGPAWGRRIAVGATLLLLCLATVTCLAAEAAASRREGGMAALARHVAEQGTGHDVILVGSIYFYHLMYYYLPIELRSRCYYYVPRGGAEATDRVLGSALSRVDIVRDAGPFMVASRTWFVAGYPMPNPPSGSHWQPVFGVRLPRSRQEITCGLWRLLPVQAPVRDGRKAPEPF